MCDDPVAEVTSLTCDLASPEGCDTGETSALVDVVGTDLSARHSSSDRRSDRNVSSSDWGLVGLSLSARHGLNSAGLGAGHDRSWTRRRN